MYSILCRNANFGQRIEDPSSAEESKNTVTKNPVVESGVVIKLRRFFEEREGAKFFLFVLVMLGTGLVIGDGILTPAISGGYLIFILFYFIWKSCCIFISTDGTWDYLRDSC